MNPSDIIRWLNTLHADSIVTVDDGGLAIIEIHNGKPTGAYLEIGGHSDERDEEAEA